MTTFKEYREKKKKTKDSMETSFGSHSIPKERRPKKSSMETSFGSHSRKKIKESLDQDHPDRLSIEAQEKMHKAAPLPNLSEKQSEAIDDYTDESRPLNGLLHHHHKGFNSAAKPNNSGYINTIKHLSHALDKTSTSEDMNVYTGIKDSPSRHFKKKDGQIPEHANVHLPAFTSTSTWLDAAEGFAEKTAHHNDVNHNIEHDKYGEAKHILKLSVPKGSKAMSVKDRSFVEGENEILLHRGHDILIHHKPEKIGENTYMWHAKIVGHSPADLSN